jgi:hypothetical protein
MGLASPRHYGGVNVADRIGVNADLSMVVGAFVGKWGLHWSCAVREQPLVY